MQSRNYHIQVSTLGDTNDHICKQAFNIHYYARTNEKK